jgi:hypothetical protein
MSVICSLLTVAFSACTGNDEIISDSRPVEIIVSTSFGSVSGVETRGEGSIYTDNILSGNPLPVSIVRLDQTSESEAAYLPYTATAIDGVGGPRPGDLSKFNLDIRMNFTDVPEEYYLPREQNNSTKLIGWYPAVGGVDGSEWAVDNGVATVSFIVDGETDVMMSDLVEGSMDHPYNKEDNKITFSHLLTRFRVRAYTYDAEVEDDFGKITSISIAGKAQTCIAQLPAVDGASNSKPTIDFTGEAYLPIIEKNPADNTSVSYDLSIPLLASPADNNTNVGLAGYAMVAPVANTDKVTLIVATQNKNPIEVEIQAPDQAPNADGFAAGKSYTLALEFRTKGIEFINVTILDWDEEETIITEIQ